ncbi:MAG: hypothetical protein HZB17_02955 [Chloroflexi bacterium]|nr:hypothetical protein [Chloroflexota bacterium]
MTVQNILIAVGALAVLAFLIVPAIKIIWQYQRGVVFRFGKLVGERGPGFNVIIPYVDRMIKVDMRVETLVVEPQEVITRDNVTVQVDAVVYFQPVNPSDTIIKVQDYAKARQRHGTSGRRRLLPTGQPQ